MKMALWCLWLCIMVALVLKSTDARKCSNLISNSPGYTMPPGDIFIEYGKPLEMYCVLNDEFVKNNGKNSSSRLTFFHDDNPVPTETIEIINSSTIRLYIEKPPPSQDWYTCMLDNKELVCTNIVFVETKPQDVKDFKCISYNFENLTCTWSYQKYYVKTSYRLMFRLDGRVNHWYDCPSPPETDDNGIMSCVWKGSTVPPYRMAHEKFFFKLTIKNKFGEKNMITEFNHYQNVLPAPPAELQVVNKTSKSLYLQWQIDSSLATLSPGVDHRILYQCEYGPTYWKLAAILHEHKTTINFNLTELPHANVLCNIKVSSRSGSALPNDESMWSANASISERVGTEVPRAPPKTTPGCFEIVSTGFNKINVYVFWQHIFTRLQSGSNFHYNISIDGEPHIRAEEITNIYAKFVDLSSSKSYKFRIWSENDDGPSTKTSEVYIPRQSDRPIAPSSLTKTLFDGGKYELNWAAPKTILTKPAVTSYTLFWCNGKRDWPYKCTGFLNWTIISSTETSKEIYVNTDDIYQFAISANSDKGISSGMLWGDCTILYRKHNEVRMKNIYVNNIGATKVDVGWKVECSDQISSVKGFIVYYCITERTPIGQNCRNVTFYGDRSLSHGNLTGLKPSTSYIITVSVLSNNNQESLQSDFVRITTLDEDSIFILCVLFVLCTIVCCFSSY